MKDREQTLDLIYAANTRSEIEKAREARVDYLREHPDDEEVLETGEMLSMLETALNETDRKSMTPELVGVV